MAIVERRTRIGRPVPDVWDTLSDFGAISRWAPNVDHSSLMTDQVDGVGAVRRIQTGGATVLETIEWWEPGRSIGYEITGLPPVIRRVTNTWRLEAAGDDTEVSLTTDIDAGPRPPQQLVAKAVGRKLAEASEQMLSGLAAAMKEQTDV